MPFFRECVIGLVTWDFDPPRGGLGRAMRVLVEALRDLGHTVHVLSPVKHPILRWTRFPGGQIAFSFLLPFILPRWMRRHRISCVLFPVGPGGIFFPCASLRSGGCMRMIAIVYHTYAQQAACVPGERWKRLFVPLEGRVLRGAHAIFCHSGDTFDHLASRGADPGRVRLLPQLLPAALVASEKSVEKIPGRCVAVMRLDRRKGFDVLLRAWPLIRHAVPAATLCVTGKGRGERRMRSLVRADPSIRWARERSPENLLECLAEAEVALCPSYLEGFGLACAEAMAAGTAVVASDAPGLRSLLRDHETALLVPPGSARALADAVARLLRDRALRERLAASGQREILVRCDPARARAALREAVAAVCSPGVCSSRS